MTDKEKAKQLKRFKMLATGMFLAMVALYVLMIWLMARQSQAWMGYVKSFAEAAMVGALADWFAVTALFDYPLGIKIPHTNLIENSKERIGDNLGSFVTKNFLNPATIKPYIKKLSLATLGAEWLSKEKNKEMLLGELSHLAQDLLHKLDDVEVVAFFQRKGVEILDKLPLNEFAANGIGYLVKNGEHLPLMDKVAEWIVDYVNENSDIIRRKVAEESYFFVPKFLENKLADKIVGGLNAYLREIQQNPKHSLKIEMGQQLQQLAINIKSNKEWYEKMQTIAKDFVGEEVLQKISMDAWQYIKETLIGELSKQDSLLMKYMDKKISHFANRLHTEPQLRRKIDNWIQYNTFRYATKNVDNVGTLISNTVGNWKGRELSEKLELEVGKDLQFIRINGTLVGGLMGLLIYTITHLFSN